MQFVYIFLYYMYRIVTWGYRYSPRI